MPGRQPSLWSRALRWLVIVVIALLGSYGCLVVCACSLYRKALYPAPAEFPSTPPAGAVVVETHTADGATARAWLFPSSAASPVVVLFHGNGETMGHCVWIAEELRRRGLGVVLAEYRGYGVSREEPSPTEPGLYADAEAVLDAIGKKGIGRERIVLWGQSLGSGVAAEMALRGRGNALVLISPYTSIVSMARRVGTSLLPVGAIVRDRYDTLSKAPRIQVPTLVVHGDSDALIPLEMGETVAKALPHGELYTVRGGHHGDVVAVDPNGVLGKVAKLGKAREVVR